jgi:hypothetical protein
MNKKLLYFFIVLVLCLWIDGVPACLFFAGESLPP